MNPFSLTSLLSLAVLGALATAAPGAILPDLHLHDGQSLDGAWKTIVDPYESGYFDYRYNQRDRDRNPSPAEAIFLDAEARNPGDRVEYNFEKSPELEVPADWNTQRPELLYYEGTVWYRKMVDIGPVRDGERLFVRFGAANYRADVYLNGRKLGTHIGGFTPFSFEITGQAKPGANSLVVRVDNKRFKEAVPTLNTDWWNYGGLTRSVKLVRTPARFIAEHRLHLESEETKRVTGWVAVDGAGEGQEVTVEIPALGVKETSRTSADGRAAFAFTPAGLELWNPGAPKLYDVKITAGADSISEPIGFRTVRTRGRELLVNGKPVFLRGICIHEEYPLDGGGRVRNREQEKRQLEWARELNCNFVRLAHYPHAEGMTRLADEMGIMVWSEVPVYWTIDWTNPDTYANAENQLTENIRRDANRASIIIWSLANETPVSEARTKFLSKLAATARELDGTRLLSAAMETHNEPGADNVKIVQDPLADIVDIVSFNQYIGWYDGPPEKADKVTWKIPYDKPAFVSEFGGGAKAGLHGPANQRWTEEYQAELYRHTLAMLDRIEGIVGFTPWVLMDFRSPKRLLPGIQDGYNRKGVLSDEGGKKQAFKVLQDYYERRQREGAE